MTLAEEILAQNNRWFPLASESVVTDPNKGVTMHKIDAVTAAMIAEIIQAKAPYPIPYALACIDIEGIFDPDCMNGNFPHLVNGVMVGSNPNEEPEGFDVGIAQIKLRYLMANEKLTLDEARDFALDPNRAIEYHFQVMVGHLAWADALLAKQVAQPATYPESSVPAYRNRYALATTAYNFGEAGALALVHGTTLASHTKHVIDMERQFAGDLAIPSVFDQVAA